VVDPLDQGIGHGLVHGLFNTQQRFGRPVVSNWHLLFLGLLQTGILRLGDESASAKMLKSARCFWRAVNVPNALAACAAALGRVAPRGVRSQSDSRARLAWTAFLLKSAGTLFGNR
jgi:hypothetical protein